MAVLGGESRNWSHRDGSVQKTLPLKHEDLSSDSQCACKQWEVIGLAANASTGKFGEPRGSLGSWSSRIRGLQVQYKTLSQILR